MQRAFTHEPDADRYALRLNGEIASVLDYRVLGDAISMTRAYTNPPYRGSGYAGELVAFAVDDVESNSSRHIVPSCWYVAEWFDRHPERAGLLHPRTA
ncbi:hypothetical protein BJ978_002345 [Agromyces terreus]|uniref:N-acetyltransferase domain-containing protein n=1 Tax=Agromyces terreus TaxID=424795 RepID=A0A9X2H8X9_9MICO|nr:GNAT family N-acetyltransferase [Agromyces terreus]MCP2371669.1 hypothetical protein [Agromyces terreus]